MMLPPKWMISAAHVKTMTSAGRPTMVPFGQHHARTMGQLTTACGEYAASWTNFYDRPYVATAAGSCPRCDQVVRDSAPSGRGHSRRPMPSTPR
jgi:hypothetical protein